MRMQDLVQHGPIKSGIGWLDRSPAAPAKDVAVETAREVSDDDVPGLAAEMAYHSSLSIVPFLLFLAGLTSIIDDVFRRGDLTQRIVDKAGQVMPEDATSVLRSFTEEVVQSHGFGAIVVGLAGALWAASSAVGTAMKALNRAYDVKEDRGFVRRKLIALALTVLFTTLLLAAALLMATGGLVAGGIGEPLGWKEQFVRVWNAASFGGAILLVGVAATLLYWLAPSTGHQFRWITPGALLFVAGWLLASIAFALYLDRFDTYNRTYGTIGAVIVLLVWLYWTNLILLIGGELNAVLARREDPDYTAENPGSRKSRPAGSKANPAS